MTFKRYHIFSAALLFLSIVGMNDAVAGESDSLRTAVAYGFSPEWERTAATSTVTGDCLVKTTSANVGNTLQGLLPGLTSLQQSAEPGYDFDISNLYLRGRTTYSSDQRMLVFVDGFESPIESLSVGEIESVTLLKDAAALALYGMRGANGVLLVTTKRGVESKPDIRARVQSGIQMAMKVQDPVDSYTYAKLYNQACLNDGIAPLYGSDALEAYKNGSDKYFYPNVNWKEEMLRSVAPLTQADLSFRGGNKSVKYFVSLGLTNNQGLYKGTDYKRRESSNAYYNSVNIRSNIDINFTKRFSAAFNFGGVIGDRSVPGGGSSAYKTFNSIYATAPNAFPVYNPDGSFGGTSSQTNPVGELIHRGVYRENSRAFQLIFTPKLELDFITKGLSLNASVAYSNYVAETSTKTRNYVRYSLSKAPDGTEIYTPYGTEEPLEAGEGFRTDWSRVNFKAGLDYERQFDRHKVTATAFFLSDSYREYGVRSDVRYMNIGARATYSYDKRYIAKLTAATTGCDDYAPGHRFGFFPALSLGWIVTGESWAKSASWLDYLKIRASVGLVGNNRNSAGRYLYDESYASTGSYLFGTGSSASGAFGATVIKNTELSWEKELVGNFGFDAVLFDNLKLTFDWFEKERSGIVAQASATTPGFVGASYGGMLPYMNVGRVHNHGFELAADWESHSAVLDWNVGASLWYARNEIKEMGEGVRLYEYQYRKGHPVGTPFVLVADGLYSNSDFNADGTLISGLPVPQYGTVKPGDIKYIDQNGDGIVDSNDGMPVGYSNVPEWNFSIRGGLKWKGLEVQALFNGVANRDIYLSGSTIYSFQNNISASPLAKDSWTETNVNATYPRLSLTNFDNNYRSSTFWKRNGSFFRLKNLYLGYDIPRKNNKPSTVCVYANATNLFTISALKDIADPESNSLLTYPLVRTVSLGLKLKF